MKRYYATNAREFATALQEQLTKFPFAYSLLPYQLMETLLNKTLMLLAPSLNPVDISHINYQAECKEELGLILLNMSQLNCWSSNSNLNDLLWTLFRQCLHWDAYSRIDYSHNYVTNAGIFVCNNRKYSIDGIIKTLHLTRPRPQPIPLGYLIGELHQEVWSTENYALDEKERPLKPIEVLENPTKHPTHTARILAAKLQYPVMVTADLRILDGLHRLCKRIINVQRQAGECLQVEPLWIMSYILDETKLSPFQIQ